MISVGDLAPAFSVTTDTGETLTLEALRGQPVVLFFYPKDDTPGCTIEACAFRDASARFEELGAVLLGVSPDGPAKHQRFKAKYRLPFTLLADIDHAIASAYGVWAHKSLFGRKYWGIVRTTFVIDGNGRVARIFPQVNPRDHARDVAEAVDSIA